MRQSSLSFLLLATLLLAACATTTPAPPPATTTFTPPAAVTAAAEPQPPAQPPPPAGPTAEEAAKFVNDAEARLAALNVESSRAAWVQATYVTEDTQLLAARANEQLINAGVELAK